MTFNFPISLGKKGRTVTGHTKWDEYRLTDSMATF